MWLVVLPQPLRAGTQSGLSSLPLPLWPPPLASEPKISKSSPRLDPQIVVDVAIVVVATA